MSNAMSRDVVLLDLFTCCVAPASGEMGSRPRITRDMIGDPLTDSFQHVAHVGATDASGIGCSPETADSGSGDAPLQSRLASSVSNSSNSPLSTHSSRLPSPTSTGDGTVAGADQQQRYLKLQMNSKGNGLDASGNPLPASYQPVVRLPHLVNARSVGVNQTTVNVPPPAVTAGTRY